MDIMQSAHLLRTRLMVFRATIRRGPLRAVAVSFCYNVSMELSVHRLHPDAKLPQYAHDNDAGMDLFVNEEVVISPRSRATVRTGIAMVIPDGYVGLMWDKSGLANRHGITILGGVIDAGYRGELFVTVYNTSDTEYRFEKGNKVTQLLIQKVEHATFVDVDHLPESERGEGHFGSTGK